MLCKFARKIVWKIYNGQKVATERPLFLDLIAAVGKQFVMLTEAQILNPAGELGLLVDQARGGTRRAAGEKRGAQRYSKNDRCNIHDIFLSSSEVKQMKNKGKRWVNFLLTIGNRPVAIRRKTLFPFLPVSLAV